MRETNPHMSYKFEKASLDQAGEIWHILSDAIIRRKEDGSNQWQDGYPNPSVVSADIEHGCGYVITYKQAIVGYCAIMINNEPAYEDIEGQWQTSGDFVVFHRVAIAQAFLGKGISKVMLKFIEQFAADKQISSVRADTNFDNAAMLALFNKTGYIYCGEVYFRGSPRKAFEKVLAPAAHHKSE